MHRIAAGGTPGFTWGAAAFDAEHQHPAELLDAADTDLYRRRGVEREPVGVGAAVSGAGAAGAVVVGLRDPNGSIRTRVSRRVSVAVAAAVVAIAGTLGAVSTLSPANHAALTRQHPNGPLAGSGGNVVTPPATTPGPSTPPLTTPTTTVAPVAPVAPAAPAASTPNIQLADVTSPSPGGGAAGPTTTSPPASPVSTATPPGPAPVTPAPASPAPVATAPSSHKPLPAQAAAAAVAAHAKH
jgi:hypothetical protein